MSEKEKKIIETFSNVMPIDIADTTLNDAAKNITVTYTAIPVFGGVTIV